MTLVGALLLFREPGEMTPRKREDDSGQIYLIRSSSVTSTLCPGFLPMARRISALMGSL